MTCRDASQVLLVQLEPLYELQARPFEELLIAIESHGMTCKVPQVFIQAELLEHLGHWGSRIDAYMGETGGGGQWKKKETERKGHLPTLLCLGVGLVIVPNKLQKVLQPPLLKEAYYTCRETDMTTHVILLEVKSFHSFLSTCSLHTAIPHVIKVLKKAESHVNSNGVWHARLYCSKANHVGDCSAQWATGLKTLKRE